MKRELNILIKSTKVIVSILLITAMFGGCKKYEQGPAFSLRSKTVRVANTWKIESYYKNDIEQPITEEEKNIEIELTKDGQMTISGTASYNNDIYKGPAKGTWKFDVNKENIYFAVYFYTKNEKTYNKYSLKILKIIKLKNNEMWLSTPDYDILHSYSIHLKSK